jgi:leucyl aminopeptidase
MIQVTARVGDAVGPEADAVVVGCCEEEEQLPPSARRLDRALHGALSAPGQIGDFVGRAGETQTLYPAGEHRVKRVILLGLGPRRALDGLALRRAAGQVGRLARRLGLRRVLWPLRPLAGRQGLEEAARTAAEGFLLGAYRPPTYARRSGERVPTPVRSLVLLVRREADLAPARRGARAAGAVGEGVWFARDLINRPGNELTPRGLAAAARRLTRGRELTCRVMGKSELTRLGAGGILAVGRGSENPPCLIRLDYRSGKRAAPHVCLVGKGITFDTGGISIKPSPGMEKMKYDMGGAGAVLGALLAVEALGLPLDVTGLVAAAENMPDGRAYKPGDVIRQLGGTTVEVVNTDAEGRIVLGDALAYAVRRKPDAIVDLATLTGACTVALGSQAVAMLGNDDALASRMDRAGWESGERVWRLPLWKEYRPLMASDVADVKNAGGREAGTIAGAVFLETFVRETPWVHLDIASTAWSESERDHLSKGATGVGVALVTRFLAGFASQRKARR